MLVLQGVFKMMHSEILNQLLGVIYCFKKQKSRSLSSATLRKCFQKEHQIFVFIGAHCQSLFLTKIVVLSKSLPKTNSLMESTRQLLKGSTGVQKFLVPADLQQTRTHLYQRRTQLQLVILMLWKTKKMKIRKMRDLEHGLDLALHILFYLT